MQEVSSKNFGLLIAYVVPGVIALWGLSFATPELRGWMIGTDPEGPTVGGFLYVTVAAVTLGMIASVIRWALLDTLHHRTGLIAPQWSDARLHERLPGYDWIVENHYRYYQFYGNSLISLVFTHVIWRATLPESANGFGWLDASSVILAGMLFAGSRSALTRYYRRTASLLGESTETDPMTNGGHPTQQPKPSETAKPKAATTSDSKEPKPSDKK